MIPLHEIVIKISNPTNSYTYTAIPEASGSVATTTKLLGTLTVLLVFSSAPHSFSGSDCVFRVILITQIAHSYFFLNKTFHFIAIERSPKGKAQKV
jgi:hypothetical protein